MQFSNSSLWMILGAAVLVSFSAGCGSSTPSEKAEAPAAAPKPAPKVPVSGRRIPTLIDLGSSARATAGKNTLDNSMLPSSPLRLIMAFLLTC